LWRYCSGAEKVYVQHKLAARAAEVAAMIMTPGSHVMVCGRAWQI